MHRIAVSFVVVSVLLLALPVATQEQPGVVARVTVWKIKAGMGQQFEEGLKRHNDFHRQQNDTWTISTWEIVTGERAGQYLRGSFGHQWEDFDAEEEMGPADAADSATNLDPYIESGTPSFYAFLADVSRPPEGEGPTPLARVVYVHLNVGWEAEFNYLIKRATDAINKTNWPPRYLWYQLISGGEQPTLVRVHPYNNWAGFKPQEKSFPAMLEEAYGRQGAEAQRSLNKKAVHCWRTEILRYRPDLSYIPEGQ